MIYSVRCKWHEMRGLNDFLVYIQLARYNFLIDYLFSFVYCIPPTLKMMRLQNLYDNTISNQAVPIHKRKAGTISIHLSILQGMDRIKNDER